MKQTPEVFLPLQETLGVFFWRNRRSEIAYDKQFVINKIVQIL